MKDYDDLLASNIELSYRLAHNSSNGQVTHLFGLPLSEIAAALFKKEQTMSNRLPELGDLARDRVTHFEGIITAYAQHITGCDRLWLEPRVDAEGKTRDGRWVDIDMLEIVQPHILQRITYTRSAPGGVDLPASR
jgi:hypothetical protein